MQLSLAKVKGAWDKDRVKELVSLNRRGRDDQSGSTMNTNGPLKLE